MAKYKEMNRKKHVAEELMVDLMLKVVEDLKYKIEAGEASSGDVRNAISLLKDNSITVAITKGEPLDLLSSDETLPFHGKNTQAVG